MQRESNLGLWPISQFYGIYFNYGIPYYDREMKNSNKKVDCVKQKQNGKYVVIERGKTYFVPIKNSESEIIKQFSDRQPIC